jgi:hypothetical protein
MTREPRQRPDRRASSILVAYTIDDEDRIVEVNSGWAEFAADNDAPELVEPTSSQTLWQAIADAGTRSMWHSVVTVVRATQRPVTIPYRCDAPHIRRWFEMQVQPMTDQHVQFRSALVAVEPRPAPIDRIEIERDTADVTVVDDGVDDGVDDSVDDSVDDGVDLPRILGCSWCARYQADDHWVELEQAVRHHRWLELHHPPRVKAGICPDCAEQIRRTLHEHQRG